MSFYKKLRAYQQEFTILHNYYKTSAEPTDYTLDFIISRLRNLRKNLKDLKKQVTNECKDAYKTLTDDVKTLIESVENDILTVETSTLKTVSTIV